VQTYRPKRIETYAALRAWERRKEPSLQKIPRQVEGFRDGADTERTMDSDQTGNGPSQSEIEFLYNAALAAFVDCTGLEAKRDEALKNGIAKTKLLYEIVGADNWEPLLKRKKIRRVGKTTGSFQPWVKHAMGVTSDEGGWVSRVASVLEEAVEKNIPANGVAEWIAQTPNGINGIYRMRSQRNKTEKRAAKGIAAGANERTEGDRLCRFPPYGFSQRVRATRDVARA
jgi:hypothetical protein